ncbi:hypothetical protein [Streptomyces sp. HD]|uniref:hypothetical protein n=1 Tax=Streptomyces sp. HD TaxID=3020892 RepID=UPI0023311CF7|nr:hypothetical protein [Streptomyces sp. HD]MDC0771502.1 hypothetical protein [Streptomyces sp. HD]
MAENLDVFGLALTPDETAAIDALNTGCAVALARLHGLSARGDVTDTSGWLKACRECGGP